MPAPLPPSARPSLVEDATCLACGCLCDDIRLYVQENRIVRAERACPHGERWFLAERPVDTPDCRIDGKPADLQAGLERAATILAGKSRVLIFGLAGGTCQSQRAAIALADRLGARIDISNPATESLIASTRSAGLVTATLGEVRHRADFVMFWRVDPATTHPRHFERYSLTCSGEFIPRGRADRFCAVVDTSRTPTADQADAFIEILPESEAAALAVLRQLATPDERTESNQTAKQTGIELARWQELIEKMKAARYGAIFFEPSSSTESLLTLARDMNRHTRFVALPLGPPGNPAGAQQVLTWQTGHSSAVDFADGYPQQDFNASSADDALSAGNVDAAVVVACDAMADPLANLSDSARANLATVPLVVLHTADTVPAIEPLVAITVATAGIETGGTVFRSDGVALPLRPAVSSPYLSAEAVLAAIGERIERSRKGS